MYSLQSLKKYWLVWKLTAQAAFQTTFINRGTNSLFLLGKLLRLGMSLLFLFLIQKNVQTFENYTTSQIIIFFLVYQFIDVVSQILYRGVYIFSNLIRNGNFDFLLAQPINPLFRSLTGQPDINDAVFLIPILVVSFFIISGLGIQISLFQAFIFFVFIFNSLLIATALHIIIVSIGVITTDIDGIIWIYRDFIRLGQFPVTIYLEPLRFALFFIIPIGMMITIPAEIALDLSPSFSLLIVSFVGMSSFLLSLILWKWSLKRYGSASS